MSQPVQKLDFGLARIIPDPSPPLDLDPLAGHVCAMVHKPLRMRMPGDHHGKVKIKMDEPDQTNVNSWYCLFEPMDDQEIEQVTLMPALLDLEESDFTLTTEVLSWGGDEKELGFSGCGKLISVELISPEEYSSRVINKDMVLRKLVTMSMKEWCKILCKTINLDDSNATKEEKEQYIREVPYQIPYQVPYQ